MERVEAETHSGSKAKPLIIWVFVRKVDEVNLEMSQNNELASPKFLGVDNRKLFVAVSIVVVFFMIDSELGYIADFIPESIGSAQGITLFVAIAVVFAGGGYFILRYVRQRIKESRIRGLRLGVTHFGVTVSHYVLTAILAIVIIQIFVSAQYNLFNLYAAQTISYGIWIITLALLSRAFFTWYRSSSKNAMVLVLALSMIAYMINGVAGLANLLAVLQHQPEVVASDYVAFFPLFDPETWESKMFLLYQFSSAAAYVLTWIGTVMMLRPYIRRIGKIKFYSIMGGAMVYYLATIPLILLGYLDVPEGGSDANVMNHILIFGFAAVLTGIIFAAAFLAVARTLPKGNPLREYMLIAAYGLLLFYVSGSATASQAAFPPFGLATVAFTGLSCYLIYTGLYSSAATVSQDLALRQLIKTTITAQSNLLDSIGTAQMEHELQEAVLKLAKKNSETMEQKIGVQPSMTDADMKDYLEIVIRELKGK